MGVHMAQELHVRIEQCKSVLFLPIIIYLLNDQHVHLHKVIQNVKHKPVLSQTAFWATSFPAESSEPCHLPLPKVLILLYGYHCIIE